MPFFEKWHEVLCNFCDSASPVSHKTQLGAIKEKWILCASEFVVVSLNVKWLVSASERQCWVDSHVIVNWSIYYLEVFFFTSNSWLHFLSQGSKPEDRDQSRAAESEWRSLVCSIIDPTGSVWGDTKPQLKVFSAVCFLTLKWQEAKFYLISLNQAIFLGCTMWILILICVWESRMASLIQGLEKSEWVYRY